MSVSCSFIITLLFYFLCIVCCCCCFWFVFVRPQSTKVKCSQLNMVGRYFFVCLFMLSRPNIRVVSFCSFILMSVAAVMEFDWLWRRVGYVVKHCFLISVLLLAQRAHFSAIFSKDFYRNILTSSPFRKKIEYEFHCLVVEFFKNI